MNVRLATALLCLCVFFTAACSGPEPEPADGAEKRGKGEAPTSTSDRASPPPIPSAPGLPGVSHAVDFAADGSGFTLSAECGDSGCRQHVAVLEAGAGLWRPVESPLPDVTGDQGITVGLTVLGPGRALITEPSEHIDAPGRTWFTRDHGSTWQRGSTRPTGRTTTVPEGAALALDCLDTASDGNGCARGRLVAVLPETGEHRVLTHQPPLDGVLSPAGDVAENALFVAGKDPDTGLPTLAVSKDRGRSWRPTHMTGAAEEGWAPRVVPGKRGMYAVQAGQLPSREGVKNGLLTLHVSTDGGGTWTRIWRYRAGVEPLSILGDPVVADDDGLTVYGETGVWHSDDQARTFRSEGAARGPAGYVRWTPLGWLWSDSYGQGAYRISADGTHWHDFSLGED
ncbi:exo-alpha-sialidase [Streptomyces sp. NPDC057877]|uniref:exo-alpha-sialidase n=1 Tax=Streptomyces sp. NPDC057877 TaxID=3346269 RepID=UPI0036BB8446